MALDGFIILKRNPDLSICLLLLGHLDDCCLTTWLWGSLLGCRCRRGRDHLFFFNGRVSRERCLKLSDNHAIRTSDETVRWVDAELLETRACDFSAAKLNGLGDGLEDAVVV